MHKRIFAVFLIILTLLSIMPTGGCSGKSVSVKDKSGSLIVELSERK